MSLYVGHTGGTEVGHTGGTVRYARLPLEVLGDKRLKRVDVCVYAAIATVVWQGNVAKTGIRAVAEVAGCSKRIAAGSVQRLAEFGHIQVSENGRGMRASYVLTSPVFGQKQGKVDVVRSTPRGKRLVSVKRTA